MALNNVIILRIAKSKMSILETDCADACIGDCKYVFYCCVTETDSGSCEATMMELF